MGAAGIVSRGWTPWRRAWRHLLLRLTDRLRGKVIKGPEGAPFLERYHLIRIPLIDAEVVIHRFVASDPDRGFHDHPYRWAASLILAGSYDELIVPRVDAPRAERFRRRLRPLDINRVDPHRYHRVLLGPGMDAWTLFVTGPRVKVWGFLAHPGAHRYAEGSSTALDHYRRAGVARSVKSEGDAFLDEAADASFSAERLEYRPFTHEVQAPDPRWWRHSPTGAELRRRREAWATAGAPLVGPGEWVLLLSGKRGAGKDYLAEALHGVLGERVRLIRIGAVTKAMYADRAGVSLERLLRDRAFKEQHRAGLTALYDELRRKNEGFELERVTADFGGDLARPPSGGTCRPSLVCVVDLRMRYELDFFRDRVPSGRLIHVRIACGPSARARRGVEGHGSASGHATETDLAGVAPDLVFANEEDGAEAAAGAMLGALRLLLQRRGLEPASMVAASQEWPRP